jgi:hypothetical protein
MPHYIFKIEGETSVKATPLATCPHAGFLLGLSFEPEDGHGMFL